MQNNRILYLAMVVVAAIFVGVTISVQRTNSPVMNRLIQQQNEILQLQKKIDQQLSIDGEIGKLPARMGIMEKKFDLLTQTISGVRQPGAQAQARPSVPSEDYGKVYTIDVAHSAVQGDPNAPVTIVEFLDIQCPYCTRFHPVVNDVMAAYPGKVKFMVKNFPLGFHPQAMPAAKAALAAGEQGKYFEMVDLLLANNRNLNEDTFKTLAGQLGLNVDQFAKDLKEKDAHYEELIKADMQLAREVDVRGTPTYYLNGKKTMARDLSSYKSEIDAILAETK